MSLRFLTEDLVTSVKRRSLVPVSQTTFQDSDIISFANEELEITIVPDIQAVREDLFLQIKDYTLVSGQAEYRIPERAIGSALKSVLYSTTSTSEWELPRVSINKREVFQATGTPSCFYLRGDYVAVNPTPGDSGTLKMMYFCRPGALVPTTEVATISAIVDNGATYTLTVGTDLSGVLSTLVLADVISTTAPAVIKAMDLAITSVAASTIVVAANTSIAVGDMICLAQTTNTPLIPSEFHPVLAQAVSCRLLEALGDGNKLQNAMAKLMEMRSQAIKLISNRVETATEFFNNPLSISNWTGRRYREGL